MKKVAFLVECLVLLCLLEVGIRMVVPPQIDVPHLRVFAEGFYTFAPDVVVLQFAFNDVDDTVAHGGFRLTDTGLELKEELLGHRRANVG